MPHPLETNVAAVVSELLRNMTPNWHLESQLFALISSDGLWDREEFEAGCDTLREKAGSCERAVASNSIEVSQLKGSAPALAMRAQISEPRILADIQLLGRRNTPLKSTCGLTQGPISTTSSAIIFADWSARRNDRNSSQEKTLAWQSRYSRSAR